MAVAHQEGVVVPIIPYTRRTNGRYFYRRRVHFRNLISRPVTIALKTADPGVARARAMVLSIRFASVTVRLKAMYFRNCEFLTGEQIQALYQNELRAALERSVGSIYSATTVKEAMWQTSLLAEAYGIARRLDRPDELTEADEEALRARGFQQGDIEFIKCDLELSCSAKMLSDDAVVDHLEQIGAEVSPAAIASARSHIMRARAEAYRRTLHVQDPWVQDAPDPITALLDERFNSSAGTPAFPYHGSSRPVQPVAPPVEQAKAQPALAVTDACPFIFYDGRRFSSVIDEIVADLRGENTWKGDCAQQRRILRTFAWITGDKPLGDYTHLDVDRFKRGLQKLPVTFRFGTPNKGAMAEPFNLESLPPVLSAEKRNSKTINRDLSTMSTVARHLVKTAWASKIPNTLVLDFAGATITIKDDGTDTRPPWTRAHMEMLFSSPVFTGGGHARHRLIDTKPARVWHDAAYFAPLLWYYHQACREEICGLRVDEIDLDHAVPHFTIKNNDVRGNAGELAGEKRVVRRRALPIHPELLRLGFGDYVGAIEAEGHVALFPELYLNEAKRGGAQFYNVAWRYMVDWLGDRMDIPRNHLGKGPDIHSIRSLGSSFYERDGVNADIRADVMGTRAPAPTVSTIPSAFRQRGWKRCSASGSSSSAGMCRRSPTIWPHIRSGCCRSRTGRGLVRAAIARCAATPVRIRRRGKRRVARLAVHAGGPRRSAGPNSLRPAIRTRSACFAR